MIKMRELLRENVSDKRFADIFVYAFKSIMDVDDANIRIEGISSRKNPTDFMHLGYNVKILLSYMNRAYYIPITFFYYKFPPDEVNDMDREMWDTMLKQSAAFPNQDLDEKFLLKPNRLFVFKASVFLGNDFHSGELLGDAEGNSILEVITQVKSIIDNRDSDPDREDKITPPLPVSAKDLVGTY